MEQNFKLKALSSMVWKFLERIIAKGITLIVTIILARILVPDDFAVISVVTIFFAFSNILVSGGLNSALIQKKDADKCDYSTVLFTSIFVSIFVYFILFLISPLLSNIYKLPELTNIIRIMGLILPINAIKSVICAYISSNLEFKKFFFSTLIGSVVSGVLGISMALKGYGAYALVVQQMSNTIIDTIILCFTSNIKLTLKISFRKTKSLFKYGMHILFSSFIGTLYTQINPMFIGLKFTGSDLAFYTKGRSFPDLVSSTTTESLSAVLFPVLVNYKNDFEKILQYTRHFIKLISYIVFPIMLGLFAIAPVFVESFLTEKWLPIVPYIRIFCIAAMFDMVHIGNCETIKAIGRSDIYLKMEIIKKTGYFIVIGLFLFFTNSPYDLAFSAIICTFIALIVNCIPNIKLINYKLKMQIMDLFPNLIIAIIMMLITMSLTNLNLNIWCLLFVQVLVGITSYLLLSIITRNKSFIYILTFIKNIFIKNRGGKNE